MPRARTATSVSREIDKSYRDAKKLILDGLKKTTVGSRANLDHVRALADLDRRHRQERADRGIDAQNLGVAAKTQWIFNATAEGTLEDHRTAGERLQVQEWDREFAELPAPQIDTDDADQPQTKLAANDELEEEEESEPEEDLESYGE